MAVATIDANRVVDGYFKITTNDGTNVTLTPLAGQGRQGADATAKLEGITTIVLNGAGDQYPSAAADRVYRVTIGRVN
jgi:hypothetical protein